MQLRRAGVGAALAVVSITIVVLVVWMQSRQSADPSAVGPLPSTRAAEPAASGTTLALPPSDREPVAVPVPAVKLVPPPVRPADFRDSSLFADNPIYNPREVALNPDQQEELKALLGEIDSGLKELRTKLHGAAARHVSEMVSLGHAATDPGDGTVDRIGDKGLRLFFHVNGQQYYADFDRNQFADLDIIFDERDGLIEAGHGLVMDFFSSLPGKDK